MEDKGNGSDEEERKNAKEKEEDVQEKEVGHVYQEICIWHCN